MPCFQDIFPHYVLLCSKKNCKHHEVSSPLCYFPSPPSLVEPYLTPLNNSRILLFQGLHTRQSLHSTPLSFPWTNWLSCSVNTTVTCTRRRKPFLQPPSPALLSWIFKPFLFNSTLLFSLLVTFLSAGLVVALPTARHCFESCNAICSHLFP